VHRERRYPQFSRFTVIPKKANLSLKKNFFFFFFCSAGVGTQGLTHARQELYHRGIFPALSYVVRLSLSKAFGGQVGLKPESKYPSTNALQVLELQGCVIHPPYL
jgi:hypothetical protein